MPDSELKEDRRQNWFDTILKKMMANGTIMRRWIAMGMISGVIFVIIAYNQAEKISKNATAGNKAICAIIIWGEDTKASSPSVQNPAAAERFKRLLKDMRATNVTCPPPHTSD